MHRLGQILRSSAPGSGDGTWIQDELSSLAHRAAESVLVEDRRAALGALCEALTGHPSARGPCGSHVLPTLLQVLSSGEDPDCSLSALECLALCVTAEEDGAGQYPCSTTPRGSSTPLPFAQQESLRANAEQLVRAPQAVSLLVSELAAVEIGGRGPAPPPFRALHALQTLRGLALATPLVLSEKLAGAPGAVGPLLDALSSPHDFLRIEAVRLLGSLAAAAPELATLLAYEGCLERLIAAAAQEGCHGGGLAGADCLACASAVLWASPPARRFLRESVTACDSLASLLTAWLRDPGAAFPALSAACSLLLALLAPPASSPPPPGTPDATDRAASGAALLQRRLLPALLDRGLQGPEPGSRERALAALAAWLAGDLEGRAGAALFAASAPQRPALLGDEQPAWRSQDSQQPAWRSQQGSGKLECALLSTLSLEPTTGAGPGGAVHALLDRLLSAPGLSAPQNPSLPELAALERVLEALAQTSPLAAAGLRDAGHPLGARLCAALQAPPPAPPGFAAPAARAARALGAALRGSGPAAARGAAPAGSLAAVCRALAHVVAGYEAPARAWEARSAGVGYLLLLVEACAEGGEMTDAVLAAASASPFLVQAATGAAAGEDPVTQGLAALLLCLGAVGGAGGAPASEALRDMIQQRLGLEPTLGLLDALMTSPAVGRAAWDSTLVALPDGGVSLTFSPLTAARLSHIRRALGEALAQRAPLKRPASHASSSYVPNHSTMPANRTASPRGTNGALVAGGQGSSRASSPRAAQAAEAWQRRAEAAERALEEARREAELAAQASAELARAQEDAAGARVLAGKLEADLEGLSSAYAALDAHAAGLQAELDAVRRREEEAASAGQGPAGPEQEGDDDAMEDLLVCLGQEEVKVARLRKKLESFGVDVDALLADIEAAGQVDDLT